MTNADDFAYPCFDQYNSVQQDGLTKREYFAAMAMQGMCSSENALNWTHQDIAEMSINQADALIKELNKQP